MDPNDIDHEHDVIFEQLKVVRNCGERNLADVGLDRLLGYATTHFAHEESLMGVLDEVDRQRHRQAHQALAFQLVEAKQANLLGSRLRAALIETLEAWLIEHVATHDALLVKRLAARGEPSPPAS